MTLFNNMKALPLSQNDVLQSTDAPLFRGPTTATFSTPFAVPALARAFLPGVLMVGFFALSLGALFAANKAVAIDHVYGALLAAGAAFVMSVHYYYILTVRDQSKVPVAYRTTPEMKLAPKTIAAATQEMMVDTYRHGGWILAGPLLTLKLIDLAGGAGGIWQTPTWTVGMVIMAILLSFIVRIGTDELVLPKPIGTFPGNTSRVLFFGVVLTAGSLALLLISIIDILNKGFDSPNKAEIEYFCFLVIAYPCVSVIAVFVRNFFAGAFDYLEGLSVFKDIAYGVVDFLIFGVLAYGSVLEIFEHPIDKTSFFNATAP